MIFERFKKPTRRPDYGATWKFVVFPRKTRNGWKCLKWLQKYN